MVEVDFPVTVARTTSDSHRLPVHYSVRHPDTVHRRNLLTEWDYAHIARCHPRQRDLS
jgi:hypothetical protein